MEPTIPQSLGSVTGIAAATLAPTLATQGFPTNQYRFVNLWVKITAFTSIDVSVYVYHATTGWHLDIAATTLTTGTAGTFMQLETRGAQRVYLRVISVVGGPGTVDVDVEGVTY